MVLMKLIRIPVFVIFFVLIGSIVNAEEKKLKFRGINKAEEFQNIQKHIINTETPTSVKCPRCKTIWDTDSYISNKYRVCTIVNS